MGIHYIVSLTATVERSMGETMKYALLNTMIGIAVVFAVLIVISMIISLFKYIAKFETGMARKKEELATATIQPIAEEFPSVEEELSDDYELVAVITAAIKAYEEACGNTIPSNGLCVRSIRKMNKTNWQNA